MLLNDWLALAGIAVAAIGLGFTWYGVHRGNQNSSAASLIALNEAARQGWERFLYAGDENTKNHQFAELANILEIGSALCFRRVFVGVSRELLTEYLDDVMSLLDRSSDAKARLEGLIQSDTTFKYLRLYLKERRLRQRPKGTG